MNDGKESKGRSEETESGLSRRTFLQASALAAGGAALTPLAADAQSGDAAAQDFGALSGHHHDVAGSSIARLQSLMSSGRLSAQELLNIYLRRIHLIDEKLDLRSIIQLNPDARRIAQQLDQERRRSGPRGPVHGIPILLKD
ncbi:MAG TPA: amidase family protein, partial [Steroidobacteraceae bacterium]|nr:amidase family protein [Steroidobacteraceae bacterium]